MCVSKQCSFSWPEGLPNVSGHINASHNNFSKTTPVFSLGRKRLSDEEIEQLKEESYDQLSEGMIQSLRTKTRKMIKSCEYFFRIHLVLRTKFTSRIKLKTCFSSQYRNKKSYNKPLYFILNSKTVYLCGDIFLMFCNNFLVRFSHMCRRVWPWFLSVSEIPGILPKVSK